MKVFISHGHDEIAKLKVKDFIVSRLNHEPIILGEQSGRQGLTIIEALEKFSQGCEFALILLIGDDATQYGGRRARQNVVHEAGFFQGQLGRRKVVLIVEKGVEIPSNLAGLFYLQFEGDISNVFADLRHILSSGDPSSSRTVNTVGASMLHVCRDGRRILMVQTFADRREWGGPSYHCTNPRRRLKRILKVFGRHYHPVHEPETTEFIGNAIDNILNIGPDIVGLGGMGRTSGRIRDGLIANGFLGEIGFWGGDTGNDACEFLANHGAEAITA